MISRAASAGREPWAGDRLERGGGSLAESCHHGRSFPLGPCKQARCAPQLPGK
jgi:hypothetical protein